jgi:hypothetical protein
MKTTYRKWKNSFSSTALKRKEHDNVKYVDGYYINCDGLAVRVYAEEGSKSRPPSLNMNMNYNGYCYYMCDNRELTFDRGYALIAAKFIRDVVNGTIEPLITNKW